jgi:hypothetical protein
LSGTSGSTALIAGIAALVLEFLNVADPGRHCAKLPLSINEMEAVFSCMTGSNNIIIIIIKDYDFKSEKRYNCRY